MAKGKGKGIVSRKGSLPDGYLSIPESTKYLGLKYEQYTRRLLLEGRLQGKKLSFEGFSKWGISKVSLDKYLAESRRTEQGRRYLLYIEPAQETLVRDLLTKAKIEFRLVLAYQGVEVETKD